MILNYNHFIEEKGRSLAEINPGSNEFALTVNDALLAIELLKKTESPILGGDILSENEGRLVYAYQLWGDEYHSLNWSCSRKANENQTDYIKKSYSIAIKNINAANEVARILKKSCYIVMIID